MRWRIEMHTYERDTPIRWLPMRCLKIVEARVPNWDSRLTAGLMARGSETGVRGGVPREWLKG